MMNVIKALMAVSILLLAACSTTPEDAASNTSTKYVFDDLEEVKSIHNWRLDSWNDIDERSLMVRTSPKTAYLLILSRPNYDLKFAPSVQFTTTGGNVLARFDSLSTPRKKGIKYPIARIYKLQGRAQLNDVKARILAE